VRKRSLVALALCSVLLLGASATGEARTSSRTTATSEGAVSENGTRIDRDQFRRDVNALWEDHITWTRLYIVSAVDGLKDVDVTAARLLRNQTEIGDAIKPFFGDEAGNQLTDLLNEHILIAADLIAAAKSGDDNAVAKTSKAWYRNGNQIADFLAGAGVGPRADLRSMMTGHLDTTLAEAVARLQGDYEAEIKAYDEVRSHIHHMADALAEGIIASQGSSGSYAY
jgi:hypothetical protein